MLQRKKRRSRQFKENHKDTVIDFEEARKRRRLKRIQNKLPEKEPIKISKRKQHMRRRRRIIFILALIVMLTAVGISIGRVLITKHEQNVVMKEHKELEKKKKELEQDLENVNTPQYIEEEARKQLKLVKPGEIIYVVEQEEQDKKNKTEKKRR